MDKELTLSLRVRALLDEARKQVGLFKAELVGAQAAVTAGAGPSSKAAAATDALADATADAAKAAKDGAAASDKHAAATNSDAAASTKAAAANEALAKSTTGAAAGLDAGSSAAEKHAAVTSADTAATTKAAGAQVALSVATGDAAEQAKLSATATTQSTSATTTAGAAAIQAAAATSALKTATTDGAEASRLAAAAKKGEAAAATEKAAAEKVAAAAAAAATRAAEQEAAELQRLTSILTGASPATERLAAAQKTLDTSLASGTITQQRHAELLVLATKRWGDNSEAVRNGGISAGQTAAAMRMLPAQITDITTSLAGGMPVWMVAIQQGGQIKDSFGGIGPAFRQIAGLFTIARVAGVGMAAGLAAVTLAAYQGAQELPAYNRALIMSGNAVGVTGDQLGTMAARIDKVVGTQAGAAATLVTIAGSGKVAAKDIEAFTIAAQRMEQAGGAAADKTADAFIQLGKEPMAASLKLTEAMNYLTPKIYEQIKAATEQGRTADAASIAQKAYADAVTQRASQLEGSLGTLERAWRGVKNMAAEAWDAMSSIGRQKPLDAQIASQQATVNTLAEQLAQRRGRGMATGDIDSRLEAAQRQLQALSGEKAQQDSLAKTQGEVAKVRKEYLEASKANEQYADKSLSKTELLKKKLGEYHDNVKRIQAGRALDGIAPLTKKEIAGGEKAVKQDVYGAPPTDFSVASANAAVQMAQLKANFGLLQASVRSGDAIITQALQDGNVSIDNAYAARLAQMRTESAAQRQLLQADLAEVDAALKKARNQSESGPLRQKRIEVQAQISLLDSNLTEESRKLGVWKIEQERQLSSITAKVRVDVANLTGNFDIEAVRTQLRSGMQSDFEAAGRLGDAGERTKQTARLNMLVDAGAAQAQFNAKLSEATRLQSALAVQEQAVQVLQQTGAISEIEAQSRIADARARQAPQLQAIVVQLLAMRDAMPANAAVAIDAMSASIGQLQNTVNAATPSVVSFGTQAKSIAIDGLAEAAGNAVVNFKSLGSIAQSTLKQIAGSIISSGIKRLLLDQFKLDTSTSSTNAGTTVIGAIGTLAKSIFGYADGGRISGPGTGTSDSVPAVVDGKRPVALSDGEWIQPVKAVQHYGAGFMEAVRTLRFPKPGYAFGGLVQAHQRVRMATGGAVTASGPAAVSAPAMVPVVLSLTNNGTPQRVVDQSAQFNGKEMFVSVFLEDLENGGPMSRGIQAYGARG